MTARPPRLILALLAAVAIGSCSARPGSAETDRIVATVSTAISHPRQDSAEGFARAAAATNAGRDGRLTVIAAEELPAGELVDPLARLHVLVALAGSESGLVTVDPVTACYEIEFNFYGAVGAPARIACPDDPVAIELPELEAPPEVAIPEDADARFEAALAELTGAPDAERLRSGLPPGVQIEVDGADVGLALRGGDRTCLLGARLDGVVSVWRPSRVQMQPGELTCEPATALRQLGIRAPH